MNNFHKPWVMPSMKMDKSNEFKGLLRTAGRGNRFRLDFSLGGLRASWADARAFVEGATVWFEDAVRYNWSHGLNAGGRALRARSDKAKFHDAIPGRKIKPAVLAKYESQVVDGTFVTIRQRVENAKDKSGPYARGVGGVKLAEVMHRQEAWVKMTKKRYTLRGKKYTPNPDSPAGMWSGLLVDSFHSTPTEIRSSRARVPAAVTVRFGVSVKRRTVVWRLRMNDIRPGDPTWKRFEEYVRVCMNKETSFSSYRKHMSQQQGESLCRIGWKAFTSNFGSSIRRTTRAQLVGILPNAPKFKTIIGGSR